VPEQINGPMTGGDVLCDGERVFETDTPTPGNTSRKSGRSESTTAAPSMSSNDIIASACSRSSAFFAATVSFRLT
jgi:hypothetical protein